VYVLVRVCVEFCIAGHEVESGKQKCFVFISPYTRWIFNSSHSWVVFCQYTAQHFLKLDMHCLYFTNSLPQVRPSLLKHENFHFSYKKFPTFVYRNDEVTLCCIDCCWLKSTNIQTVTLRYLVDVCQRSGGTSANFYRYAGSCSWIYYVSFFSTLQNATVFINNQTMPSHNINDNPDFSMYQLVYAVMIPVILGTSLLRGLIFTKVQYSFHYSYLFLLLLLCLYLYLVVFLKVIGLSL
jgi:hypothetical protein